MMSFNIPFISTVNNDKIILFESIIELLNSLSDNMNCKTRKMHNFMNKKVYIPNESSIKIEMN